MLNVKYKKLSETAIEPAYQTDGAAGADLYADLFCDDQLNGSTFSNSFDLLPGNSIIAITNIALEIPTGYEGIIRPRSGLAFKHRVFAFEGTIDSDFRGSVNVLLYNLGCKNLKLNKGERIAQIVFKQVERAELKEAIELSRTTRGLGGFGSTGTK